MSVKKLNLVSLWSNEGFGDRVGRGEPGGWVVSGSLWVGVVGQPGKTKDLRRFSVTLGLNFGVWSRRRLGGSWGSCKSNWKEPRRGVRVGLGSTCGVS